MWTRDRLFEFPTIQARRSALWRLPVDGDRKPVPLIQTAFRNNAGRFSPDGRWLAYTSDESGQWEVYLRPASSPAPRVRVSTNGGKVPRWRGASREIFFLKFRNAIIAGSREAPGE